MKKTSLAANPHECVEWARRVNSRWIVHNHLNQSAQEYLDHLAATDPARLERSCELARALVRRGRETEDPKPRFYGGLFAFARPEDVQRFIRDHLFLHALHAGAEFAREKGLAEETVQRLTKLRTEIAETIRQSEGSR